MFTTISILLLPLYSPIQESGFFYSPYKKKFMTYKKESVERRIFFAESHTVIREFVISELSHHNSGKMRISPLQREKQDLVLDKKGGNGVLIQFKEHGHDNQVFKLFLVPRMLIKIKSGNTCFEAVDGSHYVEPRTCEHYEKKPGQYFRWVPKKLVKAWTRIYPSANAREKPFLTNKKRPHVENSRRRNRRRYEDEDTTTNENRYTDYSDYEIPRRKRRRPADDGNDYIRDIKDMQKSFTASGRNKTHSVDNCDKNFCLNGCDGYLNEEKDFNRSILQLESMLRT